MVPAADVFVFLFGLPMDREVFILSRMRDEYDRLRVRAGATPRPLPAEATRS